MIQLKTPGEIDVMREAGHLVARTLQSLREAAHPGVPTADLDELAATMIREAGAKPSFLGYHGYPATICASVNDEVVHGIPSRDRVLRDGDLLSVDCGAIVDGWHADAAVSVLVSGAGSVMDDRLRQLVAVCEQALYAGIAAARVGGRLGDVSAAVEATVRPHGFGIVEGYTGHGIGTEMHQDPAVPNVGRPGRGPRLVEGLALAVEPMITLGGSATDELDDGWTVVTADGSWAAHVEHTFHLTEAGPEILTALDGGASALGPLLGR